MKLCWQQDPLERPTMKQCFEWTTSQEFERLRTEITLGTVTSISASCVSHIEPQHEEEWKPKSFVSSVTDLPTNINGSLVTREEIRKMGSKSELIAPKEELQIEERTEEILPRSNSLKNEGEVTFAKQSSLRVTAEITQKLLGDKRSKEENSKKSFKEAYTQVLMCGRDNKKGLLAMFIFPDNQRTYFVSHQGSCRLLATL